MHSFTVMTIGSVLTVSTIDPKPSLDIALTCGAAAQEISNTHVEACQRSASRARRIGNGSGIGLPGADRTTCVGTRIGGFRAMFCGADPVEIAMRDQKVD